MKIGSASSVSFQSHVPVEFWAKSETDGKFRKVVRHDQMRKCQSYIIRNLNGSAKKSKNEEFIKFYKKYDFDYKKYPYATSVYDTRNARVYMFTGDDADKVNEMARTSIGLLDIPPDCMGVNAGKNIYFKRVETFRNKYSKRLKMDNIPLTLRAYFIPKYSKKEHKLKGFDFSGAQFIKDTK